MDKQGRRELQWYAGEIIREGDYIEWFNGTRSSLFRRIGEPVKSVFSFNGTVYRPVPEAEAQRMAQEYAENRGECCGCVYKQYQARYNALKEELDNLKKEMRRKAWGHTPSSCGALFKYEHGSEADLAAYRNQEEK